MEKTNERAEEAQLKGQQKSRFIKKIDSMQMMHAFKKETQVCM